MFKRQRLGLRTAVLALVLLSSSPVLACPRCKESLASQGEAGLKMARGFSYSVLFMMAMPFALLTTGAIMVTRAVKRGGIPPL